MYVFHSRNIMQLKKGSVNIVGPIRTVTLLNVSGGVCFQLRVEDEDGFCRNYTIDCWPGVW